MAEGVEPGRRSLRSALGEIMVNDRTPRKSMNADEMVIIQRGPRLRPIIWSPDERDRTPIQSPEIEDEIRKRPSLNSKLRRRLILSPTKNSSHLGNAIARRLMEFRQELNTDEDSS